MPVLRGYSHKSLGEFAEKKRRGGEMSTLTFSTDLRREGFFWNYLDRLSRCEFETKFYTMVILASFLIMTFLDVTPTFLRMISGGISFVILVLLGVVKI